MAISFTTLAEPDIEVVAGIPIAKRGCLTVAEEMAVRDLGAAFDAEVKEKQLNDLQADLELKQRVVTILIKSRLDKSWSLEKTKAPEWEIEIDNQKRFIEPDMNLLDALFAFCMHEQRRGKSIDELETSTESNAQKKGSTGVKSSGNSSSTTRMKNGSAPKTLEVVPLS